MLGALLILSVVAVVLFFVMVISACMAAGESDRVMTIYEIPPREAEVIPFPDRRER